MEQSGASHATVHKHHTLSIADKVEILKKLDGGVSVKKICELYNIGTSTVYDIRKRKEKLLRFFADSRSKKEMAVRKTLKSGRSRMLEEVLITWFKLRISEGVQISGDMVREQAKTFHKELKLDYQADYSAGWLHRFKRRHGLGFRAVCGEKRSADKEAAAEFIAQFAKLVFEEKLSPEQIYNADETALFWRSTPGKTMTAGDAESPAGYKALKDRVTVLCCANAAGTHKCKLLVIGKHLRPRAFKGIAHLPVIYRANKKGWMTTDTTSEWFRSCFVPEARAHCTSIGLDPNCKILLVLDNCTAHTKAGQLVKHRVSAIYLPPNCTSLIQPMDNGILWSLKCKYRKAFMMRLLSAVNCGRKVPEFLKEFSMRDMAYCIAHAWNAVEPCTLRNGWHKLWPSLKSDSPTGGAHDEPASTQPNETQSVNELFSFAESLTNPAVTELVSGLDKCTVGEWIHAGDTANSVPHYTDAEIVEMVAGTADKDGSGEEEGADDHGKVTKRVSIDRLIQLTSELLKGLEQRSFISEQEIMNIYMLQEKLIKERPKLMKQASLPDLFNKISAQGTSRELTVENFSPSTSRGNL